MDPATTARSAVVAGSIHESAVETDKPRHTDAQVGEQARSKRDFTPTGLHLAWTSYASVARTEAAGVCLKQVDR
ncbi:MAG: hypothetical protein LBD25_05220 [Coriobacteriales bacterium]|nr:hypothetical protein [Coriobacteriales bacterium]